MRNCEEIKNGITDVNGMYTIDPDGAGGFSPFQVNQKKSQDKQANNTEYAALILWESF